jgi:hypothetical protein
LNFNLLFWIMSFFDSDYNAILLHLFIYSLIAWSLSECIFYYLIHFVLVKRLQPLSNPHTYPICPKLYLNKVLNIIEKIQCYSFEKYVRGFFLGAEIKDIYLDNIISFLAWCMYGKDENFLTICERKKLLSLLNELHHKHDIIKQLQPGLNPKIKHVSMTLDPINFIHRPLALYLSVGVSEAVSNTLFFPRSFKIILFYVSNLFFLLLIFLTKIN